MVQVEIPMLGQSGMEVKIEAWFAQEGDRVTKGETLYELSNEKLSQEIESPVTGVLVKILKEAGEVVDVGVVIAHIEED